MVNRANGHRANGNRADVVAPLLYTFFKQRCISFPKYIYLYTFITPDII